MTEPTRRYADDLAEIQALNAAYNFSVDEKRAADWAACFTRTGVFHALLPGERPTGPQELAAFMDTVHAAFGHMRHLTTNEIVTVDSDTGDTATQKCYLLFFASKDGVTQGNICVYDDVLVREDGAWKYQERKVAALLPIVDLAVAAAVAS